MCCFLTVMRCDALVMRLRCAQFSTVMRCDTLPFRLLKKRSIFKRARITAHHCRKLCASQPHHKRITPHHCQKTTHPTHSHSWLELPCLHCWRGGRPKLCQERPLQELARGSAGAGVGPGCARSGHCRSWRGGRLARVKPLHREVCPRFASGFASGLPLDCLYTRGVSRVAEFFGWRSNA